MTLLVQTFGRNFSLSNSVFGYFNILREKRGKKNTNRITFIELPIYGTLNAAFDKFFRNTF